MTLSNTELAMTIDHTLLTPEATPDKIDQLCEEAVQHGFFAVCIHPIYVKQAVNKIESIINHNPIKHQPVVVTVAGFPFGADKTETKVDQAHLALSDGATEVDMVVRLGALMDGDLRSVKKDIECVSHAVHQFPNRVLKVILETGALTDEQIISGCRCCAEAEADFVKTSTGYHSSGGATCEHVRLLHRHATPMRVKASGGIRTFQQALSMIDAGASRIGTSSGVEIMQALKSFSYCNEGKKSI